MNNSNDFTNKSYHVDKINKINDKLIIMNIRTDEAHLNIKKIKKMCTIMVTCTLILTFCFLLSFLVLYSNIFF